MKFLVSELLQYNFHILFPIEVNEGRFQICGGRFGSLTQTRGKEIDTITRSKEGNHGYLERPSLLHNQGPESQWFPWESHN